MSEPFMGEIKAFSFSWEPKNWARCAGQRLPICQHQALFSLISTYYGGDGRQ
jgi:microcystin-dependent protein